MSRSLRRGVLAATVLSLSIASLSACGAGNDAQTLQVKPDNAATAVGDIKIQNANVITQPDLNAKGPAVISVTLFNNGAKDQKLTAISVDGTGKSAKLSPAKGASGPITVPAGGSVVIGGEGNAAAVLASGRESVKDGGSQPLTFNFSSAGKIDIAAFVVPAQKYFTGWGPSEVPQPSGSATPSGTAKPSESATPTGEATPTGAASPTGKATNEAHGAHEGH
ncbi:copper chaperone PCu(A)C [Streptomyces piniterrae]|uniref:Copper chaperone PCu(A)C n=1 Tax=Streptomyces piniterrae TaxID=2571125 RepID=A0A4U0NFD6_9ACTN|nr:copper chaperone PCu(A)C [Streptomyces piniterrae]TJZ52831.1 copper chaperone PCu(A)C [Streptomyces piniterrae]